MSILVDQNTRLLVQGITGREGSFHTERMLAYGTYVVGGVTPGKGGQSVCGVPVFDTVREAAEKTHANATILFVPAKFTYSSAVEAVESGLPLVLTIAEHVPVLDMMKIYALARAKGARLFGPNSFGIISPGKSKAGFMADTIFTPGNVGLMSRSATNCYETAFLLTNSGIGQSTCIGIGGDSVAGSSFLDVLPDFEADPDTRAVILIGEIGGDEEEKAAAYILKHMTKPVAAMIAGKNAPKGRTMGHAGAIVAADGTGGAEHKESALRIAGVEIAENTQGLAEIARKWRAEGRI